MLNEEQFPTMKPVEAEKDQAVEKKFSTIVCKSKNLRYNG